MADRGATERPEVGVPLVCTVERAAAHLGVPVERVEEVAATLDAWGTHANGEPVWRLRELQARLGRARPPQRRRLPFPGRFLGSRRDDGR